MARTGDRSAHRCVDWTLPDRNYLRNARMVGYACSDRRNCEAPCADGDRTDVVLSVHSGADVFGGRRIVVRRLDSLEMARKLRPIFHWWNGASDCLAGSGTFCADAERTSDRSIF